jgi:hypothetical protein
VDEVDHDRHVDLAGVGFGLDAVDLVVVAINERDPGATVVGVAPFGLVEDPADHGGGVVLHHAGHQPLVARTGGRPGELLSVVRAGQNVVRRAGNGPGIVHAADLGHALTVTLLSLREPGGQFVRTSSSGLGGGGAQRVRTHDDAPAIAGDDEDVVRMVGGQLPLLVEGVEVSRRPLDQGLQLAFAQALSGAPPDRLPDAIEGASRRLHDGQPAQAVGVELDREVQVRVGGTQVGVTSPPIGQASDLDLAEHDQQPALMASLYAAPGHSVGAYHCLHARLPLRPQVQVVLEHLAEQLAALHVQALLQLAVAELARICPLQPAHDPLESIAGGGEGRRGLVLNGGSGWRGVSCARRRLHGRV